MYKRQGCRQAGGTGPGRRLDAVQGRAECHHTVSYTHLDVYKRQDLDETRWNMRGLKCRYYTTTLHKGAFDLPAYVEEMLEDVE